jgi:dipeptidyl-peptidase-3
MKTIVKMIALACLSAAALSCGKEQEEFKYLIDEFADLKIMKYQVPGWDGLTLQQKEYIYHLAEAAKYGRDIIWMQNCKYNLQVRKTLENILENYDGDRECEDFKDFETYAKRVFFSNGIHHHYAEDKFFPVCSKEYFAELMRAIGAYDQRVLTFIYDYEACPQRKSTDKTKDIVVESAVNFYEGVTKAEVEQFYAEMVDPTDPTPVSYGLNSKVVKGSDGTIHEEVYKVGGLYGHALEKICAELEKAAQVAENKTQKEYIEDLISYYKTGDLKLWDEYNINWVKDTLGTVDFVNGFVEDYNDPLGRKATWEGLVNFKDVEASRRAELIS